MQIRVPGSLLLRRAQYLGQPCSVRVPVESVTITVKMTVAIWVGVPDNNPALENAIPFGKAPLTIDHA
jgi:hypothetical protein